jgi:predicted Zn-dependent protease
MYPRKRFLFPLVIAILIVLYFLKNPEKIFYVQQLFGIAPCQKPLTYKIQQFDPQFNISQENFLDALKQAENIWEAPLGINLFEYAPNGKIDVSLIYDYRQKTTQALSSINKQISSSKQEYDNLKRVYSDLKKEYEIKNNILNSLTTEFQKEKLAFDAKIKSWNTKGGAPKEIYNQLNLEKQTLQQKIDEINQKSAEINNLISKINETASNLNVMAKNLNITVDTYNTIGQNTPREFNEGIYESDSINQSIKIYQFENKQKLIRVLAHEFGHAIGLDHVPQKEAIMYELNTSNNMKAVSLEIINLKKICHTD